MRPAQPKLASRPKAESTRGRVFLIPSLAAESHQENAHRYGGLASERLYDESDPIGLSGGSYSTYAYALNNPISNDDPDGQQVAAGAGIGTLVEPGLGTVIGAAIGVGIEAAVVHEVCKDHKCPPCKTVSGKIVDLGQIAYRPLDTPPPGKPQHGIEGPHYNIYMAHQNPNNCQCFWQPIGAVAPADLPPGAIPIEPFAN
jgi:hypothetical protein